jgi:hypothetical protein
LIWENTAEKRHIELRLADALKKRLGFQKKEQANARDYEKLIFRSEKTRPQETTFG